MDATLPTFDLLGCLARAREASRALASAPRDRALHEIADALGRHQSAILAANAKDLASARERGDRRG